MEKGLYSRVKGIDDAMIFQVVGTLGSYWQNQSPGAVEVILIVRLVHKSLFANYFPVIIDKDVAHNGIHPTSEIGVGFKFVFVIQSLERCLLATNHSLLPGRLINLYARSSSCTASKSFSKTVSIHFAQFLNS